MAGLIDTLIKEALRAGAKSGIRALDGYINRDEVKCHYCNDKVIFTGTGKYRCDTCNKKFKAMRITCEYCGTDQYVTYKKDSDRNVPYNCSTCNEIRVIDRLYY